jgi:SAM-dependent methyltransferase
VASSKNVIDRAATSVVCVVLSRPVLMRLADRLVDVTARRPSGWIAHRAYGGSLGAPKGHEAVFDQILDLAGALDGERCLEIGCGGGRLLERVLAAGAKSAAGLDHSADMLTLSRERNQQAHSSGAVELKLADAGQIPWPESTFSVALSANAFFFIERPELALAELHRVLTPGGRLIIATVPGPLPARSLRNWWIYVWGSRMHVHDDATMRSLLERAGFSDVAVTRPAKATEPLQLACATR